MSEVNARVTPYFATLGERIRGLRAAKGMSQSELGEEIGVTWQQLQKYEKGKNRVPVDRAVMMARYFSVSLEEFFGDDEDVAGGTATGPERAIEGREVKRLIAAYNAIKDRAMRKAIVDMAESAAAIQEKSK